MDNRAHSPALNFNVLVSLCNEDTAALYGVSFFRFLDIQRTNAVQTFGEFIGKTRRHVLNHHNGDFQICVQLGNIYKEGGMTLGQDEKTAVVYGMPRVAWELGHVMEQVPLDKMARRICEVAKASR